jgi:hypothetical protein
MYNWVLYNQCNLCIVEVNVGQVFMLIGCCTINVNLGVV